MSRISKALLAVLAASWLLVPAGATHAQGIKERTLKFSFVLTPETPLGLGAAKFAEVIGKTGGVKLTVKLFPGGALGGDMAVISSLQGGTVDFTAVNAGLLYGLVKDYAVIDIPYLFNNEKEADAIVDGPIGKKLTDQLPAKGLIGLAFWEYGFRNLSNSKRAVAKLEDIQGLKIRVVQAPIYIDLFNTLGANAVPLPLPELYNALEQKTVDGQENPTNVILLNRFGEVQKFVSLTKHIYNPLQLLMSKKTWDKMSPEERKVIQDAANEAKVYERKVAREQDAQAAEALRKAGVQVNEITPQELARMRDKAKPVIDKYSKEVGEAMMKEVNAGIAKVRTGK
jgi:tripartite ATP-independent transporter DctP family solute receptor